MSEGVRKTASAKAAGKGRRADEPVDNGEPGYDRVTQASLNGLYVKARELDRGYNEEDVPATRPPGSAGVVDALWAEADSVAHASDATSCASTSDWPCDDSER